MFDLNAAQYPRLCRAMRRTHGLTANETAALILAARFPGRATLWTVTPCSAARQLIETAFTSRPRALAN